MNRPATTIIALVGTLFIGYSTVWAGEPVTPKQLIVPGVGIGDFTLGMNKDEVLSKLGKPKSIDWRSKRYSLRKLPIRYRLHYGDISFEMIENAAWKITVYTPYYRFENGLGVGDVEETIVRALGKDFHRDGYTIIYEDQRVAFTFHDGNKKVERISIQQAPPSHNPLPGPLIFPKIDRRPQPDDKDDKPEVIKSLSKYDPDSHNLDQVDLRYRDLSKLDLRNSIDDLLYATFDGRTVWPARKKMPIVERSGRQGIRCHPASIRRRSWSWERIRA
jgi:hypothetical protein